MSFAVDVKNELSRLSYESPCCRRAEVAGLLRMGGVMTLGAKQALGFTFTTENAAVARKVLVLLKEAGPVRTEVTVSRYRRLKKNNTYTVRVIPSPDVLSLLDTFGLAPAKMPTAAHPGALLRRACCRVAFLRGCFLAGGSVNRPEAAYHLEFVIAGYTLAELVQSLLKRMKFPAGITERKDAYIVYLKEGDAIVELLGLMEAEEAVEAFEITRNLKEVRNQVNRLVNCETANINKTAVAAAEQCAIIRALEARGKLCTLPEALREAAEARLAHPDATLAELGEILHLGKSGINHRLRKITALATKEEEVL